MDVFALLFILSFIALIITLIVMSLYKKWKMKSKVAKGSKHIGWVSDMLGEGCKFETFWMKQEVNETQEKWKETSPKHSTRIKNHNRRKGKKK